MKKNINSMHYVAIAYTADRAEIRRRSITAPTTTAARERAHAAMDGKKYMTDDAYIRVLYALDTDVSIMRAAIAIARKSAACAVSRGGNDVQRRIYDGMRAIVATTYNMYNAADIAAAIGRASHDVQDWVSTAAVALTESAELDTAERYHAAYIALNRYTATMKTRREREVSTEYIAAVNGGEMSADDVIDAILYRSGKWVSMDGGKLTAKQADKLGIVLATAAKLCTARELDELRLMCRGYGVDAIAAARLCERGTQHITDTAEKLRIHRDTVHRDMLHIRAYVAEIMRTTSPEMYKDMALDVDALRADIDALRAAHAARDAHRTEDGKARKKASDKATQAARARAYRERKKQAAALMAAALKDTGKQ